MRHIYIVPFNFNQVFILKYLKHYKITPIALDDHHQNYYAKQADYSLPIELNKLINFKNKIDSESECLGIIGLNSDFGVKIAAELSNRLNIRNIFPTGSADNFLDKYNYLRNFNNDKSVTLTSPNSTNYIAKPRYGSGSRGVVLHNPLLINETKDMIYQKIFRGREYSIDGFFNKGQFLIFTISKRKLYKFSAIEIESINPTTLIYKSIKSFIIRNLKFIVESSFPFHLELINDKNNGFKVIDFSPRGGGFTLGDIFINRVLNIDLGSIYCKFFIDGTFNFPNINFYRPSIIYFLKQKKGIFKELQYNKSILNQNDFYFQLIKPRHKMSTNNTDADRIGFFLLTSDFKGDLIKKLQMIKKSVKIELYE